jgi:hypothetical protein
MVITYLSEGKEIERSDWPGHLFACLSLFSVFVKYHERQKKSHAEAFKSP